MAKKGHHGIPRIIVLVFASGLITALVLLLMPPTGPDAFETLPAPVAPEENIDLSQTINSENHIAAPKVPPPPSIAAQADLVPLSKVDSLALDQGLLRSAADKMLISNYFSKKYNHDPASAGLCRSCAGNCPGNGDRSAPCYWRSWPSSRISITR